MPILEIYMPVLWVTIAIICILIVIRIILGISRRKCEYVPILSEADWHEIAEGIADVEPETEVIDVEEIEEEVEYIEINGEIGDKRESVELDTPEDVEIKEAIAPVKTRKLLLIDKKDQDPDYHYGVVADWGGRVEAKLEDGYEYVTDGDEIRVQGSVGKDRIGYLMRKKIK